MSNYKCYNCKKELKPQSIRKKVRCVYCGSKIIYKERIEPNKVKAR